MRTLFSKIFMFSILSLCLTAGFGDTALAAKATNPSQNAQPPLGNDISWPQCSNRPPTGQAFGIVGVNGGLANNTNPCFVSELAWAQKSVGGTGQPKAALYVNTANPGSAGSWWPTSNTYGGAAVSNPYGTCTGSFTDPACAYMYGYAKAYDDTTIRGVANPSSYTWWLDVETTNSWQPDKIANTADLEGMVAHFRSIGAQVGLYSTNYQWDQIVGTPSSSSNLNGLRSWIAGAASATDARAKCSTTKPLTVNSPVTLVQFVSKNLDYDYSCI
jgi:hypothetical protein